MGPLAADRRAAPAEVDRSWTPLGVQGALRAKNEAGAVCKMEIKRRRWRLERDLWGQTLFQEHWAVSERF